MNSIIKALIILFISAMYIPSSALYCQCPVDGTIDLLNARLSGFSWDVDVNYTEFLKVVVKFEKRWNENNYEYGYGLSMYDSAPFDGSLHSYSTSGWVNWQPGWPTYSSPYSMTYRWTVKIYTEDGMSMDTRFAWTNFISNPRRENPFLGVNSSLPDKEKIQLLNNTAECFCNEQGFDGYESYSVSSTSSLYTWKPLNGDWGVSGGSCAQIYNLTCGEFILEGDNNRESSFKSIPDNSKLDGETNELKQNYPNPFNPKTTINYSVKSTGLVTLKVYDILGNEVASIVNERKEPGDYSVTFNATNLPSGIYVYRLTTNDLVQSKKLIVMK